MESELHAPVDAPARRRGFALPAAIFALVIIGALIAGAFFTSTQEFRVGRNTLMQQRAFAAAEYGLNDIINNWSSSTYLGLSSSGGSTSSTVSVPGGGTANVVVTRLNTYTFWIVSEGVVGSSPLLQARRKTNTVVRLNLPNMTFLSALTLHGPSTIGGSSVITGADSTVSGWPCGTPSSTPLPGIVLGTGSTLDTSGSGAVVTGASPPVQTNPLASSTDASSIYFNYGNTTYDALASSANITQGITSNIVITDTGLASGTPISCQTGNTNYTNWGDVRRQSPAHKCESYFPIIHWTSDLHITGGKGQGVLLVDGDLEVSGGFEFYGPVIAKGHLKTTGTGGHFHGGVMAADVELEANTVLGNAQISYSSCAISTALQGATPPSRASQRAWADMF